MLVRDARQADSVATLGSPGGLRAAAIRGATIHPGPAVQALEARGYAVRDSWRG